MRTKLPNIRRIFLPDPGYVMFDCDLSGADAQVVAWEAGDERLKDGFRNGIDVHSMNAEDMWGSAFTSLPGDSKQGPKAKKRKQCKQGVHATNYLGSAQALAKVLGWTVHESQQFQKRWLDIHPEIRGWHDAKRRALLTSGTIANAFGYTRTFFDRIDSILPEAVAWSPQSTVAIVCFEGALALEEACPWAQILLQNHDSLVFQVPEKRAYDMASLRQIRDALHIPAPFENDPLYIPWEFTRSATSWGDCEKEKVKIT